MATTDTARAPVPSLILSTRCAHWGWDEHQYFGHAVFEELVGHESFMGLTALSVLGRRLSPECCDVLQDLAVAMSMADPRIWPLKLTRLIAAYGAAVPAAAAGLLIQQGARIGPWVCPHAAHALVSFHAAIAGRADDDELVQSVVGDYLRTHAFVWGFGTPFRARDERLVAFRDCVRRRGRDQLPHWQTMDAVATATHRLRKVEPNIALAVAAACLDMGLTEAEIGPVAITLAQHMFFANAVEGAQQAPALLRHLPDTHIAYTGRSARPSPRATSSVDPGSSRVSRSEG
jgi:hypothetical protein